MSISSQEADAGPIMPREADAGPLTLSHRQKRVQKAGSKLATSGDDTLRFFQVVNGKKQCKFCL
jgi:hypothetical protein